jgi:hypothetical protein
MFTCEDLEELSATVAESWRAGAERDWATLTAGTLDWTCSRTADHTVDCTLAPAIFLASRRTDSYPDFGAFSTPGEGGQAHEYVEALEIATRLAAALISSTPSDVRAIIWRRPRPEVRGPEDFAARSAVELALHAHDICAGLGVGFVPPHAGIERLRRHVQDWPYWGAGWPHLRMDGDAWDDLLATSGRGPALR